MTADDEWTLILGDWCCHELLLIAAALLMSMVGKVHTLSCQGSCQESAAEYQVSYKGRANDEKPLLNTHSGALSEIQAHENLGR